MKLGLWVLVAVAVLAGVPAGAAEPSLTVYSNGFAVVRDTVRLNLERGVNTLAYTDITAQLEPNSVILRDPAGRFDLQILEQNYRNDPVSQQLLLSRYEGQTIDFLIQTGEKIEIKKGKIIRSGFIPHPQAWNRYGQAYYQRQMQYGNQGGNEPLIEMDGTLRFGLPGKPLFPALTDADILKPTLDWQIYSSRGGNLDAELAYLTGGMTWTADYNFIAPEHGNTMDLVGWVTIDNQSGKTFTNAKLKLMAGDVSKLAPEDGSMDYRAAMATPMASMSGPQVTEKAFDEYHLYTLPRPTTLHDRETKQIEFLRAAGITTRQLFVYDGAKIDYRQYRNWQEEQIRNNQEYGAASNPSVWAMREFVNSEANHLGMPLPAGRMRFYRRDDDGQLEFTGENAIRHTPKDETVRVYTGNAFDLVGERRRTQFQVNHQNNWLDESFEITLRNHKTEPVEIRVVEHLYRGRSWSVLKKSAEFSTTESQTIEFRVTVNPNEEKVITYTVHYTW